MIEQPYDPDHFELETPAPPPPPDVTRAQPEEDCYVCRGTGYVTHIWEVGRSLEKELLKARDVRDLIRKVRRHAEMCQEAEEMYKLNGNDRYAELLEVERTASTKFANALWVVICLGTAEATSRDERKPRPRMPWVRRLWLRWFGGRDG